MGTDIHVQIEYKQNGKWHWIFKSIPKGIDIYYLNPLNTDRNYRFFAMLADVRNGVGFAGVKTGEPIKPISLPKGLPKDLSKELLTKHREENILGEHSFSYLTAEELNNYFIKNDENYIWQQGYVDYEQYLLFKKNGKPEIYCGDVGGGETKKVTNEVFEKMINNKKDMSNVYTLVRWTQTFRDVIGFEKWYQYTNLGNIIEKGKYGMEDIRIVFGFDS